MHLPGRIAQKIHRYIHRHILLWLQMRYQPRRLRTIAGAQINQAGAGDTGGHDGGGHLAVGCVKNGSLGTRGVVLVQAGDGFKQLGAQCVVKIFGRYAGSRCAQPCGQLLRGAGGLPRQKIAVAVDKLRRSRAQGRAPGVKGSIQGGYPAQGWCKQWEEGLLRRFVARCRFAVCLMFFFGFWLG